MILKFGSKDGTVVLNSDKAEMIDITNDLRTKLLNKNDFLKHEYKADDNVYFVQQPFFIRMAQMKNRPSIEALYINYKDNHIIIVNKKSYVFYNGKSIDPGSYDINISEQEAMSCVN